MRSNRIESLISNHYSDSLKFELVDESHQHAGRQGQESHFKLLLVSDSFKGKSRVQRQREINALLSSEFQGGLHALSMRLLTLDEFEKQASSFKTPDCQGSEKL